MYRKQMEEYSLHLEDRVREQTKEISEAHERLSILDKAKSDFLDLIAHELRSPLTTLYGAGEVGLSQDDLKDGDREEFQQIFQQSYHRLRTIIDQALLLTRIEVSRGTFRLEPTSIYAVLEFAVASASDLAESHQVQIGEVPDCEEQVLGDEEMLVVALSALLETAVKLSSHSSEVSLSCEPTEDELCIRIRAVGSVIPQEAIDKFFEVLSISTPITPGGALGLGPPVAERIIRLFGGSVTVENQDPPGISFTVTLRLADPPADTSTSEHQTAVAGSS